MDSPKQLCFECETNQADPSILGIYDICQPCFQATVRTMQEYKKSRTTTYPEIDEILPRLFLGNEDAAVNADYIKKHGINAVLVCGTLLESPFEHLRYKKLAIADDPRQSIIQLFEDAVSFVHGEIQQDRTVLIHCAAGVSRSPAFTIAYLMKHKKMSYEQGRAFVKSRRPVIQPNSGFVEQLRQYEQQLKKQ